MQHKTMAAVLLTGALLTIGFGAGTAVATHDPVQVHTCTYEVGPGSNAEYSYGGNEGQGDVPLTSDGSFNYMGCQWEFPDSSPCEGRPLDESCYRTWEGGPAVEGEYAAVQVSIVDDVWGAGVVGGIACMDVDVDYVCGDESKGELGATFCGTGPVFESTTDTNGNGHNDLGGRFLVILSGVAFQSFDCSDNPEKFGISGGVLDPAGGIFLTFSG